MDPTHDVFVSHNSTDTTVVVDVAARLKGRGIKVWLDVWECTPGMPFQDKLEQGIRGARAIAIMLGPQEIRPWVTTELRAAIDEEAKRQLAIIPVLLPGAPQEPDLPLFLRQFTWVDMRAGISEKALDELHWGITGVPPAALALGILPTLSGTSSALASACAAEARQAEKEPLDSLAMAAVKRKLHVSSELIAQEAATSAALAAKTYPHDALTLLVPLLVDLRWGRGYAAAFRRLFRIPEKTRRLGDFDCQDAQPPCSADAGLLAAEQLPHNRVLIKLDSAPAAIVANLTAPDAAAIVRAVNAYGRLGAPEHGGLSTLDRIKAVEVSTEPAGEPDELAETLYRHRDLLIPLVARWGMPGQDWLLHPEEEYPSRAEPPGPAQAPAPPPPPERRRARPAPPPDSTAPEGEAIPVRAAWHPQPSGGVIPAEILRRLLEGQR